MFYQNDRPAAPYLKKLTWKLLRENLTALVGDKVLEFAAWLQSPEGQDSLHGLPEAASRCWDHISAYLT